MKVELQCGDVIAIPEDCKAIVKDGSVIFEREQKFKDGDILAYVDNSNHHCPFIYKGTDKNGFDKYYIGLDALNTITLPNCTDARWGYGALRHATDKEKQQLFDKMKEQGLCWNTEEKRVEKIRWRAEDGKKYYLVGNQGSVMIDIEGDYCIDEKRHKSGNYFRTKAQAEEAAKRVKEVLHKYHEEIGE